MDHVWIAAGHNKWAQERGPFKPVGGSSPTRIRAPPLGAQCLAHGYQVERAILELLHGGGMPGALRGEGGGFNRPPESDGTRDGVFVHA